MKNELLKLALEIVTSGQRDRFAENPVENIFEIAKQLSQLADHVIQESQDSLILQPATLDVATLKKRSGESLVYAQKILKYILKEKFLSCNLIIKLYFY